MKEYQLSDLIEIKHGYAFDGEHIVTEDNGIVLVTPGNFKIGGGFQEEKCKFFTGEIPKEYVLSAGDYIVTMTDLSKTIDTLGYSAIVPKSKTRTYLHNQRIGLIKFVSEECDPDYIYYLMQTHEYQRAIANTSTGATVHHTSPSKIKAYKFLAPEIEKQKYIAKILHTYDDLIENNQKQIKLLEEAAQRLYKEWFVNLRFPGYENTPVVDGVPEGWEEGMIQDIVIYHDKKRKPLSGMQRAEMQGKYRYYGAASILDYVNNYLFDGTYLLLGEDGTVITEDGYPILQYVTGKFWVNNHAHVLTGKMDYPTEYLYMMFKATKVRDVVTGVAQPKISQARLSNKKTIIPSKEIVRNYCSIVSPMFKQILNLEHQIELHKEARDRLLPKLMSGDLEV